MSIALIAGVVALIGGIAMLLVMESKIAGVIASGVGALFLALSFYGDMAANTSAASEEMRAQSAEFSRDYEATNCAIGANCDPERLKQLAKRAESARSDADAADAKRKDTLAAGERTRKPLMDALTREVDQAASATPSTTSAQPDSDVGMGN